MKKQLLVFVISFITLSLSAQEVRVNEAVSSNSIFLDEDGDSPDWFEFHNYGSTPVSINNWAITDDATELNMWTFPDITLQPDEYLMVWASKKDRSELSYARTLVNRGDVFKYKVPSSEISQWTTLSFDDSSWLQGNTGIGYADGDDVTVLSTGTKSVFTRKTFNVSDVSSITKLILDIDYDDGFVAYINGQEVARANINGVPPVFNSGTIVDHEAKMYSGGKPDRFVIDNPQSLLNNGNNVLSIQLHNISNTSSDMTLIPFLSAIFSTDVTDGITPPSILELSNSKLHTNFKISSKSETLTLSDDTGNIIDELFIEGLFSDSSIGVSTKDANLVYYTTPTPGKVNDSQEFLGTIKKDVVFSNNGGKIINSFSLTISGNTEGEEIRYTTDATVPTESSALYQNPIVVNATTVIRARLFKANYISSLTNSKTFLFNASHNLPVVTLVTDPYNLFDNDYGIYVKGDSYDPNVPYWGANFWEDRERPVQFSLYEDDGSLGTEFNAGIKVFGGWSRANEQRSLSIFARGQYGTSEIDYPIFPDLPYDKYQALVLRNSGNDWLNTMVRDASLTSLMDGADIEFQDHRSTVVYINGEYWGIYNLREKVNEHFLASKKGVDADALDLLELEGQIVEGDNQEYLELIEFIKNNSLVNEANYNYVAERVDIDNFILYQSTQIYFNNTDWPGNNIKYWKSEGGKWRWILYDTDFGFGIWDVNDYRHDALSFALEPNGPDWPNPAWSTLVFRKLIENKTFRNKFINRSADEMNTRFLANNVNAHIQQASDVIYSENTAHYNRWGATYNPQNIANMKTFSNNRSTYAKYHIRNKFNIPSTKRLTLQNDEVNRGFVEVNNNLIIELNYWGGDYFQDIPIALKAIAEPGFEFSHWSGSSESTNAEIELSMASVMSVKAHFVESSTEIKPIVINEINYKSGDVVDAGDWIELYNPNDTYLDISNWKFKDSNDANIFTIPDGTSIDANSYLVITKSSVDFTSAFPDVKNFIGDFDFGLSSSGDAVRIFNSELELQDEVNYGTAEPWPTCANGQGPTLELKSPDLDNSLPENWDCLSTYGTPGVVNDATTGIEDFLKGKLSIYPNPIEDYLYLKGLKKEVDVRIIDTNGKILEQKKTIDQVYLGHLESGVYILNIILGDNILSYKIVKK